jgi:hypothetical protein
VKHQLRRAFGVALAVLAFATARSLVAQQRSPVEVSPSGFSLEQNYPNPFNPETRIPFVLSDELFVDGRPSVVTIRIFNILQQVIAVPTALRHHLGEGVSVANLEYPTPGRYEAFWDGTDRDGRQVASGIYLMQITVNGASQTRKMYVTK